jgi:hypothetical protein
VSATTSNPTKDNRADQILDQAERYLEELERAHNRLGQGRVNRLPQTKNKHKNTPKFKQLQDARKSA